MNILVDGQTLGTPEINRGIGVYFRNVFNNMVKQSYEHNWYVTLANPNAIKYLDPWVSKRVKIISSPEFAPGSDFERTDRFTDRYREVIEEYKIDLFWIPNPMMVNVLFPNKELGCPVFATMYDLIPAIMPVKEWPPAVQTEYDRRLQYIKNEKVSLLCISEATRKDFKKYVGEVPVMEVTFLAADSRLFYKKRKTGGLSDTPNIVFTGGFDYRKNIDGALETLKKAKDKYKGTILETIKFYIICKCDDDTREWFGTKLKKMGLDKNVVLTGFVSDEELADYYANADVFFFPSLYEGFGLPIIEAMLGGAYILSADNSSLPEVCGGHAILGAAADTDGLADKLYQALKNAEQESAGDKNIRQDYACDFTWEDTAMKTLKSFLQAEDANPEAAGRKKIAIVSPWPNQRTGIATYVYKMMPYLGQYFEIDLFVDRTCEKGIELLENQFGALFDIEDLDKYHEKYYQIIYHIGNNSQYHTRIYEYMRKYPGIAEIHDFVLQQFFYYGYFMKNKEKEFLETLEQGYGSEGREYFEKIKTNKSLKDSDMDRQKFPMCHAVQNNSKAVIFHNHWSQDQMKHKDNVYVVPLAAFEKEAIPEEKKEKLKEGFRNRFGITDELVVGCFGFVNENKRPDKMLHAAAQLIRKGCRIKLIYFGECNMPKLSELIRKNEMGQHIHMAGYLNHEEYEAALDMTDIIINLRYPTMGEASATLCEAFKYGKPVLVSQINQYLEYPDEVCWKVPVGRYEVQILKEMIAYLADHEEARLALGNNAKAYADEVLNGEKIAGMYHKAIHTIGRGGM